MKKTRRKKADEGRGVMVWLSRIACSYSPGTEKIWKRHGMTITKGRGVGVGGILETEY